jgi:hypothetical protein
MTISHYQKKKPLMLSKEDLELISLLQQKYHEYPARTRNKIDDLVKMVRTYI